MNGFPADHRGLRHPAILIALCLVLSAGLPSQETGTGREDAVSLEYDIKAVFLYQFTKYLEWPSDRDQNDFQIVVLGECRIVAPLQEIARKKTVGSKAIAVRQCAKIEEIGRPRILFISKSAAADLEGVLKQIRGTDILTIGETEGFGFRGAAINFVMREGSIKFEMNEKALKDTGIRIGSQLLKLAILIEDKGSGHKS